jgi:hypothetical protein
MVKIREKYKAAAMNNSCIDKKRYRITAEVNVATYLALGD